MGVTNVERFAVAPSIVAPGSVLSRMAAANRRVRFSSSGSFEPAYSAAAHASVKRVQ